MCIRDSYKTAAHRFFSEYLFRQFPAHHNSAMPWGRNGINAGAERFTFLDIAPWGIGRGPVSYTHLKRRWGSYPSAAVKCSGSRCRSESCSSNFCGRWKWNRSSSRFSLYALSLIHIFIVRKLHLFFPSKPQISAGKDLPIIIKANHCTGILRGHCYRF